ncbi:MAG: DUF4405 domain-containing protein [Chitinophagaceae bacterium]|nr:DUF4405 domain-containing protein [Chitinophagaceae bacterium]
MKNKNLVSLNIGLSFLVIAVSGIIMYIGQKNHAVETLHILFGLIFLSFIGFHIKNNWGSLKKYSFRSADGQKKWSREIIVGLIIFSIFFVGGAFKIPLFETIAHGVKKLANTEKRNDNPKYEVVEWIPFIIKKGTTEEQILKYSQNIQKEFFQKQAGFFKRDLLKQNDSTFVEVIYWKTKEEAQKTKELLHTEINTSYSDIIRFQEPKNTTTFFSINPTSRSK